MRLKAWRFRSSKLDGARGGRMPLPLHYTCVPLFYITGLNIWCFLLRVSSRQKKKKKERKREKIATILELVFANNLLGGLVNVFLEDVGLALELVQLGGSEAALLDDVVQTGRLLGHPPFVL